MEEEELKLLNEIDLLHEKLVLEPGGTTFSSVFVPPSGYSYKKNASTLLEKVIKLKEDFNSEYIDILDIQHLEEVCKEEEVDHVLKATDGDKNKLSILMKKATGQIELELLSLFDKIKELKEAKLLPLQ